MKLIVFTMAMGLTLVALVEGLGATSKQVVVPVAPVYCTEVDQVASLPLWRLPHDGTPLAMQIYTDEQHIADWFGSHLDVSLWLELEPVQLGYPYGLAWRIHSARHYDTETGATLSYVETRVKQSELGADAESLLQ